MGDSGTSGKERDSNVSSVSSAYGPANGAPSIELHNSDCARGMETLGDGTIDVVVTSPPYNIGTAYGSYDDTVPRSDYITWLESVALKIRNKLTESGSFFLNIGSSPANPWGPFEAVLMLRKHFHLQNVIHWIKSIYIANESYGKKTEINVGHYKPINSNRFLNDAHEYIFHLTKSNSVPLDRLAIGVPYKDSSNIARWDIGSGNLRCRGNTWYVPYRTIQSRERERPHPASFPPEIPEMCIRLHGIGRTKRVMDPFMGIGNTALACRKLGVACIGFEIDPQYYSASLKLLSDGETATSGTACGE